MSLKFELSQFCKVIEYCEMNRQLSFITEVKKSKPGNSGEKELLVIEKGKKFRC